MTENNELDLDTGEQMRYENALTGYGLEVTGETPETRLNTVKYLINGNHVVIDCSEITQDTDFVYHTVNKISEKEISENAFFSGGDITRELTDREMHIILHNFDSMDEDEQTNAAQVIKGVAERLGSSDVMIAYTSSEGGKVVEANFDLASRVYTLDLDE